MSLDSLNIIRRIYIYRLVAEKYKEDIDHIRVFNEIKERFGFNHCVVCVKFELKNSSNKEFEILRILNSTFYNSGQEENFSFRLGHTTPTNDRSLSNEKEEIHYDYISNLLKWFMDELQIDVKIDRFLNERVVKYLEQKKDREYDEKITAIEEAFSSVIIEVGYFIAFKNYSWEKIQIGRIEKIIPPSNAQGKSSFETISLLSGFKPGAKRNKIEPSQVYAVIRPDQVRNWISKAALISSIVEGNDQESLLWRRAQELWEA